MREFTQRLNGEDLTRGLQPKELGFGSVHASELLNLRPETEGLRGYEFLNDPFEGGVSVSFPFPQLYETSEGLLLFQQAGAFEVDESDPWGTSSITLTDPDTGNFPASIGAGGVWHFAALGRAWYATNGVNTVFRLGAEQLDTGGSEPTYRATDPTISTLTAHKGRVFSGGFTPDAWGDDIEGYFSTWQGQTSLKAPYDEIDQNWIVYSSIGGGDFPFWLFDHADISTKYPPLAITEDKLLDRFRRNEAGFLPLPTKSEVQYLKPLGDNIVAYCNEAIFLLQLEFPRTEELPAMVGYQKLLEPGVLGRGAVGGNKSQHVFIDQLGRLWRVSGDGGAEEIGYRNQFEQHIDENVWIDFERSGGDFYIGFEDAGYLLTTEGLCEIGESPTFVIVRGTDVDGLARQHGKTEARYVGAPNDFADRGHKTATSIAVGYGGSATVKCAYDYRYTPDAAWERTDFQTVNKRGISYIRTSGGAFRPVVEADDPTNVRIDYIELRAQYSDKRHQRGPRVGQSDS